MIQKKYQFQFSDDDPKSDYSSICGPLKVERNRSIIPMNHPRSLLHPGKIMIEAEAIVIIT